MWIRREAGSLSESLENKKRQLAQLHQDVEQSMAKVKRQERDIKVHIHIPCWLRGPVESDWCVTTGAWGGSGAEERGHRPSQPRARTAEAEEG